MLTGMHLDETPTTALAPFPDSRMEPPQEEFALSATEEIRIKSLCGLNLVVDLLMERAVNFATTTPHLLDLGNQLYRYSGLAAKQEAARVVPYTLNIVFGDGTKTVSLGSNATDVDFIEHAPARAAKIPVSADYALD